MRTNKVQVCWLLNVWGCGKVGRQYRQLLDNEMASLKGNHRLELTSVNNWKKSTEIYGEGIVLHGG